VDNYDERMDQTPEEKRSSLTAAIETEARRMASEDEALVALKGAIIDYLEETT
jgi:c-di-AMP phosphodiesterase-like protein